MTASFISLQQNGNSGWNIVEKSFPEFLGNRVRLTIAVKVVGESYEDKKAAEVAAAKMAELNKLPFVSENSSVITVIPSIGCYLPVELTPDGGVIEQGISSPILQGAVDQALAKASDIKVPFLAPAIIFSICIPQTMTYPEGGLLKMV